MYKKILVAHERLNDALHALEKANELAQRLGAELCVLGIYSPEPEPVLGQHESVEELEISEEFTHLHELAMAWAHHRGSHIKVETQAGQPIKLIEQFVKVHGADLLVLGDIDQTSGWGSLIDHSAQRVGQSTDCDVLIVR